jgi:hypothetical protein
MERLYSRQEQGMVDSRKAGSQDASSECRFCFLMGWYYRLVTCVIWLIADVNECDELNNRMSLCKNAKCINTEGSYKCLCLPGYVPSDKPNYCTPLNTALNLEKDSDLE